MIHYFFKHNKNPFATHMKYFMVVGVILFTQSLQTKPEAPADFHTYYLNVCDHRNQFKVVKL